MKLEVGMYVRTKKGSIGKILGIDYRIEGKGNDLENIEGLYFDNCIDDIGKYIYSLCFYIFKDAKTSHNITELLEEGDYVNGMKVNNIAIEDGLIFLHMDADDCLHEDTMLTGDDIKTVVTKEQFESMSYKVGDIK